MTRLLEYDFVSDTGQLSGVRERVRSTLKAFGCGEEFTETSVLAVDEAVSNVIRHGYGPGQTGSLQLTISRDGAELVFALRDDAAPFDGSGMEIPAAGELRAGGYGRFLIHEVMDQVRYAAPADRPGNLLEMRRGFSKEKQDS